MKKTAINHHNQIVHRAKMLLDGNLIKKNLGSVLIAIATFSDKNGNAFPAQSTIGQLTDYKRETVNRLVTRLVNDGWLTKVKTGSVVKNGRRYNAKLIYKINIRKMTTTIGKLLKTNRLEREVITKNDHSATPKNDHTINTTYTKISINTSQAHTSQSNDSDLSIKIDNAVSHEMAHQQELRHNAARKAGLKNWQIKNGLRKSDEVLKKEEKQRVKIRKHHSLFKSVNETFKAIESRLIGWSKFRADSVSASDIATLDKLLNDKQLNAVLTPVAAFNKTKWLAHFG